MGAERASTAEQGTGTARGPLRRAARGAARGALALTALGAIGWAGLAIALDGPGTWLAWTYALASLALLVLPRARPWSRVACAALFALVLAWWLSLEPSNERPWQADVARLAAVEVSGERVTFRNVRNFEHAGDQVFTPRWEERSYDLSRVAGVDLLVCDWGEPLIVHTILGWEFDGGEHLAVSIETRKEVGEGYSALLGFFRRFELYYAVADERDVIGVRANVRGERVRLYRLALPAEQARSLLLDYARRIDQLNAEPAWYNALTHNCTTSIRLHAVELDIEQPWDWRILVNGRAEELLHSRGLVDTSLPFEELRARSDVTDAARAAAELPDFSARIRRGLPPRPRSP